MCSRVEQSHDIKVEVIGLRYRRPETGWTVMQARQIGSRPKMFDAVGVTHGVGDGDVCILTGVWSAHRVYGEQFCFEQMRFALPPSRAGLLRYLGGGAFAGVGPKTAAKIVDHFGDELGEVLESRPETLLTTPHVPKKKLEQLVVAWKRKLRINELMVLLHAHGFGPRLAESIVGTYLERHLDPQLIRDNPYRMISEVRGVGFLRADRMARVLGVAENAPERVAAALVHLLESAAEQRGHTFQRRGELEAGLRQLLGEPTQGEACPWAQIGAVLGGLLKAGTLSELPLGSGEIVWQLSRFAQAERRIAAALGQLLATPLTFVSAETEAKARCWLKRYVDRSEQPLSPAQQEAILAATFAKVFVLTGGPGVGKTTTVQVLIRLFKAMGKVVALCAPTGRAAQRMVEVTGFPAQTIHRLLGFDSDSGRFVHHRDHPLSENVVLVDEASMLDTELAADLFAAVRPAAQLVLVGDADQLPSVGPGAVLRDLLAWESVARIHLDQVFRQASTSRLIALAHEMHRGHCPGPESFGHDCRWIAASDAAGMIAVLRHVLREVLPAAGYDPVSQVQVLAAMNKGPLGCDTLNPLIQSWLNPAAAELRGGGTGFVPGDKVLQRVNNYEKQTFNGDIGFVSQVGVGGKALFVQFGERQVAYEAEQVDELVLAYAITIHKSQGSEFPVVIIPLSLSYYVMLERHLYYTALTRAKVLALLIGDLEALRRAVANPRATLRQTGLSHALGGALAGGGSPARGIMG